MVLLTIFVSVTGHATTGSADSLTSGAGNEYNPSISRASRFRQTSQTEWLIYERQTNDSSFIVVKKYNQTALAWEPNEIIISRAAAVEIQRRPDICSNGNISLAAWQRKTKGGEHIQYSTYSMTTQAWTSPQYLTNDTLTNENVRIQPTPIDSQYVLAWQNKNIIRSRMIPSGQGKKNDTIAISNDTATTFDLGVNTQSPYFGAIVYSITTGTVKSAVVATFNTDTAISVFRSDTLKLARSVVRPRFVQDPNTTWSIIFEAAETGGVAANIYWCSINWSGPSYDMAITDARAGDVGFANARLLFYHIPVITKSGASISGRTNFVLVTECGPSAGSTDNGYFIINQYNRTDSIVSIGYNRNPVIGGRHYSPTFYSKFVVPIVWESNRSGKTHLYGMNSAPLYYTGVEARSAVPATFALQQNFPNPFNPTTRIDFTLPSASMVSLKIYDMMGREVASIVSEELSAGTHSRQWDASAMPSGMYFYRMQAGSFSAIKRLVVVK